VIAHRAGNALALADPVAALDAAIAAGADGIELDVRRGPAGELVVAHDPREAAAPGTLSLAAALERLRSRARPGFELLVDLKEPDTAAAIAAALAGARLLRRRGRPGRPGRRAPRPAAGVVV